MSNFVSILDVIVQSRQVKCVGQVRMHYNRQEAHHHQEEECQ